MTLRTLIYLNAWLDRRRELQRLKMKEEEMLRLVAVAGFALSIATSAHGMSPAPLPQPDDMVTQIAVGCGAGRTRIDGVCVARTTIRQTRRAVRRCVRWQAGVCAAYE